MDEIFLIVTRLEKLPRPAVYHQAIRPRRCPLEIFNVLLPLIQKPGDDIVTEWESERRIGVGEKLRVEHPDCLIRIADVVMSIGPGTALR